MRFDNKIILVTGAASGIGQETVLAFAKEGGTVVVSDLNEKGGLETVEKIKALDKKAVFIQTNVSVFEEVEALMTQIQKEFGRLDVAINNAGISGEKVRTHEYSVDTWEQVMAINASSVFYCMKTQIPIMLAQGGGVIVNNASIAGLKALPSAIAYVASKHAVVGMTKTAAVEYARKNIRINAVCPAFTVTPMFDPVEFDKVSAGFSDKMKANVPMKRFAEIQEQVNAILWLSSEQASYVTGHALPVDGGMLA